METLKEVYIKKTRKFHDAWAFILYLIVYIGCTTYIVLNIKKGSVSFKFIEAEIYHTYICFSIVTFFIILNFGGLSLFPNVYLKIMICFSPIITTYIAIQIFKKIAIVSAIFYNILWIIFVNYYWSKIYTIASILKISMRILLNNILAMIYGIVICSTLQILQLYLIIQVNIQDLKSNYLISALIFFNMCWSLANITYFYKVYVTGIISYHYINKDGSKISVCKGALKNSFYALGSISFAGFIIALIYTAKSLTQKDDDQNETVRSTYNVEDLLMRIISFIFGVVIEVAELVHDLTLPYLAIHGESYIQSIKHSYKIYTDNVLLFGGLKVIDYSLQLSSFFAYIGCYGSAYYAYGLIPKYLQTGMVIRLIIIAAIPLILYFTSIIIITSSFLGLIYFNLENPDLVKDKNPEIEKFIKNL